MTPKEFKFGSNGLNLKKRSALTFFTLTFALSIPFWIAAGRGLGCLASDSVAFGTAPTSMGCLVVAQFRGLPGDHHLAL